MVYEAQGARDAVVPVFDNHLGWAATEAERMRKLLREFLQFCHKEGLVMKFQKREVSDSFSPVPAPSHSFLFDGALLKHRFYYESGTVRPLKRQLPTRPKRRGPITPPRTT